MSNGKIRYGLWANGSLKENIKEEENFINQIKEEENNYLHFFTINKYEEILKKVKKILSF